MAPFNSVLRHLPPAAVGELMRFVASGLLSYGLGIGLAALFREVAHLPEEISVALCLIILLVTNFFIDRNIVFRSTGATRTQFLRFVATSGVMRGAEYMIFLVFLRGLSLNYLIALTAGMVISNGIKFVVYRSIVFSSRPIV